ncbi:MAG: hypothetical protein HY830_15605 [Actinobacteria bacterium]|nr:hypothetical protein [Actinomycetota bacterium]
MTTTLPTPGHYDVLNAVVLKQMAVGAAVSEATGVGLDDVDAILAELAGAGLVFMAGDSALPTDGSAPALAEVAALRYAALRSDPAVLAEVDRFEDTNTQMLATMTRWQTVEVGGRQVPNDHTDPAYDEKVVARIDRLVQRLGPLLDALAAHDPRFALYRQRFDAALDAVDSGRREFVSSPTHDSVHTVWFEFHEDLLRALGRARTE